MSLPETQSVSAAVQIEQTRIAIIMASIGVALLVAAGAVLWWREGDKLFSDGLITVLMRCF